MAMCFFHPKHKLAEGTLLAPFGEVKSELKTVYNNDINTTTHFLLPHIPQKIRKIWISHPLKSG